MGPSLTLKFRFSKITILIVALLRPIFKLIVQTKFSVLDYDVTVALAVGIYDF
jgi:hypothetical protein